MSLIHVFYELIKNSATQQEQQWLTTKTAASTPALLAAFVATPRFIGRHAIQITEKNRSELADLVPDWPIESWTLDRLCRVFLLLYLESHDKTAYIRSIETLFDTAELQELVALYSALPVLAYPEHWVFRATEAVRSNMGPVFDAVALGNPYPAAHFSEAAWNQLVLKCIFNDKPIHRIVGLDQRANQQLADNLSDFAHERWAAGRQVPPQVWRLVSKFMNETLFEDIKALFSSPVLPNQQAAALVSAEMDYEPAHQGLGAYPDWKKAIRDGALSWQMLES
ncbi:MAG: EboA domain-containing protein [Cytophagaceae bacterium]|nr:EboA domain-containing protein [Cytophagaceae bacterium]